MKEDWFLYDLEYRKSLQLCKESREDLEFVMWLKKTPVIFSPRPPPAPLILTYWLCLSLCGFCFDRNGRFSSFFVPILNWLSLLLSGVLLETLCHTRGRVGQNFCGNYIYPALGNNKKIHLIATVQWQDCPSVLKYKVSFHFAMKCTP